jgi:hypothetical protein
VASLCFKSNIKGILKGLATHGEPFLLDHFQKCLRGINRF